jgi:broad specificity phosphatase PhoE
MPGARSNVVKSIVVVQHCQSMHHVNADACLWPDKKNGLTERGRRKAICLASRLQSEVGQRPCGLYCSDMQRTHETAQILSERLSEIPTQIAGLRGWNGRFAIERTESAETTEIDDSHWSSFDWRPVPAAETWREFYERTIACMDKLVTKHDPDRTPILVVHGGTLSNIVAWWLRLELDALPERAPFLASPGSLNMLRINRYGNPVIGRLNDTAHLDAHGLSDNRPLCT